MRRGITKEEHFNDGLKREMPHDELMKMIAIEDEPAYLFFLEDGEEVYVSKESFHIKSAKNNIKYRNVIAEQIFSDYIEGEHNDKSKTYYDICEEYLILKDDKSNLFKYSLKKYNGWFLDNIVICVTCLIFTNSFEKIFSQMALNFIERYDNQKKK